MLEFLFASKNVEIFRVKRSEPEMNLKARHGNSVVNNSRKIFD